MTDSGIEQQKIEELKSLKTQIRSWRWGFVAAIAVLAMGAVSTVNTAFKGLTKPGPKQDVYVKEVTAAVRNEIAPMVEDMARSTLTEVKPQVELAVDRVNARMPEVAQAALDELDTLQANLPVRGEAVLQRTFGTMLASKEDELKAMFPEATDEQITRLLTNLGESAQLEAEGAAVELFGRHHETLEKIHAHLETISAKEAASLQGVDPTWEMGILVLDLFRDEAMRSRPDKASMMAAADPKQALNSKKPVGSPKEGKPVSTKVASGGKAPATVKTPAKKGATVAAKSKSISKGPAPLSVEKDSMTATKKVSK